jgi:2-phosphoglycerate kinase
MDPAEFTDAFVVQFIITCDDEGDHRSHFLARAHDNRSRPSDRYLEFFDNIRKIQRYVKSLALERNVPIVPSYSLDATLAQVIELVVSRALEGIPAGGPPVNGSRPPELQTASARRTHDR